MIIPIEHKDNCILLIKLKNEQSGNDTNTEYSSQLDHDFWFEDSVPLKNNQYLKYYIKYKGIYNILQRWNNATGKL